LDKRWQRYIHGTRMRAAMDVVAYDAVPIAVIGELK